MSQVPVKYAHPGTLLSKDQTEYLSYTAIPVVPLSALREVVEGLRTIAYADWSPALNKQIAAAMERGELKHITAVEWLAQRLLTSLGEQ